MSKWISHLVTTLAFSGLISGGIFFTPTLTLAAQATLAWDHNNPVPDGYCIFQRTDGQAYNYSQPTWIGAINKCTISNLKDGTTYYFVVRAYSESQQSTNSNEVEFVYRTPSSTTPIDSDGVGDNADADDDNDGMPDTWEIQYGLDPKVDDALNDTDADGTANIDEYSSGTNPSKVNVPSAGSGASNIVIDDGQTGTSSSGEWLKSGAVNFYGSKSLYSKRAGAVYNYQSSISGAYDVEIWWTEYASRCTDVPVEIYDGNTLLETVELNQKQDGGQWNYLGIYEFTGIAKVVVVSKGRTCTTGTDAVKLSKADSVGGADQ